MAKISIFSRFLLAFLMVGLFSCKSQFEKVRTSNNPELIYKTALEFYEAEEYQKAQSLLELALNSYRGRKESEDIYFKYAYTYYYTRQYILASYYFKNFSQTYSTSRFRTEADFMEAYSNYQLSPTFRLDQSYTQKAIDGFQLYVNTYPQDERVEECNRLIDELRKKLERKAFEEAKLYFDLRRYQSAIWTFDNLLKDFPETDNAEEVRYWMARAAFLLAQNSVIDRQIERFEEAKTMAEEFLARYTDSEFRREMRDIQTFSAKKLNDLRDV